MQARVPEAFLPEPMTLACVTGRGQEGALSTRDLLARSWAPSAVLGRCYWPLLGSEHPGHQPGPQRSVPGAGCSRSHVLTPHPRGGPAGEWPLGCRPTGRLYLSPPWDPLAFRDRLLCCCPVLLWACRWLPTDRHSVYVCSGLTGRGQHTPSRSAFRFSKEPACTHTQQHLPPVTPPSPGGCLVK